MPAVSLVKSKLQTPPANRKASSNVKKDPELEEKGAAVLSSGSASQDFQDPGLARIACLRSQLEKMEAASYFYFD